jgi:hypothetical protein
VFVVIDTVQTLLAFVQAVTDNGKVGSNIATRFAFVLTCHVRLMFPGAVKSLKKKRKKKKRKRKRKKWGKGV